MAKRSKFGAIIDSLSWIAIISAWLTVLFLRLVQSTRPGMLGTIKADNGPIAVYFSGDPIYQFVPVIAGTLLFMILSAPLRKNPVSIPSRICRCLRLATAAAACYFTVTFVM